MDDDLYSLLDTDSDEEEVVEVHSGSDNEGSEDDEVEHVDGAHPTSAHSAHSGGSEPGRLEGLTAARHLQTLHHDDPPAPSAKDPARRVAVTTPKTPSEKTREVSRARPTKRPSTAIGTRVSHAARSESREAPRPRPTSANAHAHAAKREQEQQKQQQPNRREPSSVNDRAPTAKRDGFFTTSHDQAHTRHRGVSTSVDEANGRLDLYDSGDDLGVYNDDQPTRMDSPPPVSASSLTASYFEVMGITKKARAAGHQDALLRARMARIVPGPTYLPNHTTTERASKKYSFGSNDRMKYLGFAGYETPVPGPGSYFSGERRSHAVPNHQHLRRFSPPKKALGPPAARTDDRRFTFPGSGRLARGESAVTLRSPPTDPLPAPPNVLGSFDYQEFLRQSMDEARKGKGANARGKRKKTVRRPTTAVPSRRRSPSREDPQPLDVDTSKGGSRMQNLRGLLQPQASYVSVTGAASLVSRMSLIVPSPDHYNPKHALVKRRLLVPKFGKGEDRLRNLGVKNLESGPGPCGYNPNNNTIGACVQAAARRGNFLKSLKVLADGSQPKRRRKKRHRSPGRKKSGPSYPRDFEDEGLSEILSEG